MEIRPIKPEDEQWVKKLFEANESILGGFGLTWYRFNQSTNPREKWVVIEGKAFAHYMVKKNGEVSLYEIAVGEKKKGHGKRLLEYMGFPMELKTDKDNEESNAFYKKCGFICLGSKFSKNGKKEFNIWKRWS